MSVKKWRRTYGLFAVVLLSKLDLLFDTWNSQPTYFTDCQTNVNCQCFGHGTLFWLEISYQHVPLLFLKFPGERRVTASDCSPLLRASVVGVSFTWPALHSAQLEPPQVDDIKALCLPPATESFRSGALCPFCTRTTMTGRGGIYAPFGCRLHAGLW